MPDLEPITRDEKLWSGEDLEPITRREMYIKHLYDETQVIPDKPITREEMFILKAGEELHDVTIEQLNVTENGTYSEAGKAYSPVIVEVPETTLTTLDVTENGTYTAPSGTAYNEVDVDVPLPENAYLLKDVEGTPSDIATFTDGSSLPMPSLKVGIEPVQDLHGYDSPWVGGAGKNKAKPYSYTVTAPNGVTFTYNGDGSVTLNGTATASQAVPSVSVAVQNDLTFTLGSGTWIPSVSANNVTYEVYDTATSTLLSNGASFTLTEAKTVLFRVGAVNGQTYNNLKVYMQIESGSTATSYAPYSNICPISGHTEANVTRCGKNLTTETSGSNKVIGKATKGFTYTFSIRNRGNCGFNLKKNNSGDLIVSTGASSTNAVIVVSFTADEDFNIFLNGYGGGGQTFTDSAYDYQLELGSEATTYEPYNGQTYNIQFTDGSNPLTVYGGTLDVVSGVLTVDREYVDLGTLTYTYDSVYRRFSSSAITNLKRVDVRTLFMTSTCYKCMWHNESISDIPDGSFYNSNNESNIYIHDSRFDNATDLKNALSGQKVVYPLATPTTFYTQPTSIKSIEGVNNVWADTGDIEELEYFSKEV